MFLLNCEEHSILGVGFSRVLAIGPIWWIGRDRVIHQGHEIPKFLSASYG